MRLEMGSEPKPAATLQRRQDGYLQTLESAENSKHTELVDADEDESEFRGTRDGVFSEGSRTGGSGNILLN